MGEILTNSTFVTGINKIITKLGGTPSDISITFDQANDIVNNSVFASKMDEIIKRYSGTPTVITLSDDEANDMVNTEVFSNKIDELSGVISGGGGGSSIVHPVNVTIVNSRNDNLSFIAVAVPDLMETSGYSGFYVRTDNTIAFIDSNSNWLPTLQSGTIILPTAYILEDTAIYLVDFMGEGYAYSIVGDAIEGEAQGLKYVAITGDCTITVQ